MTAASPATTLAALRRLLLGLLAFGLVGTATDLLLIGHDEDAWQLIPLAMISLALVATVGLALHQFGDWPRGDDRAAVPRSDGAADSHAAVSARVLHYRANMEFKLEMDPSLSGLALFSSVVRAKAPPALAPATWCCLGLLGLAPPIAVLTIPLRHSLTSKGVFHAAPLIRVSTVVALGLALSGATRPPRRSARA